MTIARSVTRQWTFAASLLVGASGATAVIPGRPTRRAGRFAELVATAEDRTLLLDGIDDSTVVHLKGMLISLLPVSLAELQKVGIEPGTAREAHAAALRAWARMGAQVDGVPFAMFLTHGMGVETRTIESTDPEVLAGRMVTISEKSAQLSDPQYEACIAFLERLAKKEQMDEAALRMLRHDRVDVWLPPSSAFAMHLVPPEPRLDDPSEQVCVFELCVQAVGWAVTQLGSRDVKRPEGAVPEEILPETAAQLDELARIVRLQRESNDFGVGLLGQAALEARELLTGGGYGPVPGAQILPEWQVREEVNRRLDWMPCWALRIGTDVHGKDLWYAGSGFSGRYAVADEGKRIVWWNEEVAKRRATEAGGVLVPLRTPTSA